MELESIFVYSWNQNGIYIQNWLFLAVVQQRVIFALQSFPLISGVSGFPFFLSQTKFENPEIPESFSLLFLEEVNAFRVINKILQIIQCDYKRGVKVLLKVIDASRELNLETVFLICQVKIVFMCQVGYFQELVLLPMCIF